MAGNIWYLKQWWKENMLLCAIWFRLTGTISFKEWIKKLR